MDEVLRHWTAPLADELAGLYRDLHRHPELSLQEHRTAATVAARLAPLGCDIGTGVGGTGIVAVLRNGDGPVVMLRADMDALPVAEDTGLPYASTEKAVAHACGHDMHTASLLGALEVLSRARDNWAGTVVGVFQPAEELACGAQAMIDDGLFDRFPTPAVVLGQHVGPLPAGMIGHAEGPLMAGMDSVQVTLFGRGGHASLPEVTVDPVLMAAATVVRLQGVVAREVSSSDRVVLTVGRLQAGTKDNIIPETAELGINIRHYSAATRDLMRAAIERIVRAEAAASGAVAPPRFDWNLSAPVLISDAAATAPIVAAFQRHFGADRVAALPPVPASEDVGVFGQAIGAPTVFWFFGGLSPQQISDAVDAGRPVPTNHSPHFAPVIEPTLTTGVEAMTVAALQALTAA
jgi:amidohydrolase